MNDSSPIDAAHGGEGWQLRPLRSLNDIGTIWADCGCNSEHSSLKTVLLHRPGKEIAAVSDPASAHWDNLVDLSKARDQHDGLAEVYKRNGVEVIYLEPGNLAKPNHYFMRDLLTMTPEGAIVMKPASVVRRGEEVAVQKCLALNRYPILMSVSGHGYFEGPDVVYANPETVFLGIGLRSNLEGAMQIKHCIERQGFKTILVQTTYGCGHLDGVLNIVDKDKVLVIPTRISYLIYETLKSLDFTIIELPHNEETLERMAINIVPLAGSKVLMPSNCPETRKLLAKYNIESIEVDVSELMKGGGALHCMTGVLKRELV